MRQSLSPDCHVRDDCRLCGGHLSKVLDLGRTPAANEFVPSSFLDSGVAQETFPLYLSSCLECGHVQLPVVVDPERLFGNYVYVSGTSPVFVDHFRRYSEDMIDRLGLRPGDLVVDIGSNDGTLLSFFKSAGMRVLGVDPAKAIAADATHRGIPTIPEFLTPDLAVSIAAEHGRAKLVTANNVFAHADNLREVAVACDTLLDDDGLFSFEVSYLPSVVRGTLFDTVYHEHTSYHHLTPLVPFLRSVGLSVVDAQLVGTHGGSIRVISSGRDVTPGLSLRALDILSDELMSGYSVDGLASGSSGPMADLSASVQRLSLEVKRLLVDIRSSVKTVAGFGAPAKVTTLMHRLGLGRADVDFIVDDSPLKQGLYTPGKYIPILPPSALYERRPDYVIVLAWNFAEPIMRAHKRFSDEGGVFIVPIPQLKVLP